jgi:hypothetical protein
MLFPALTMAAHLSKFFLHSKLYISSVKCSGIRFIPHEFNKFNAGWGGLLFLSFLVFFLPSLAVQLTSRLLFLLGFGLLAAHLGKRKGHPPSLLAFIPPLK